MVQVTKDPMMKKGAMLTTFISLPGRHIVLMPGTNTRGISRKIEEEEERKRLKELLQAVKIPEGFGVIVRTAGQGCTKAQISKDLNYLLRLWSDIQNKAMHEQAPATLYKERSLAVRSIRDYFTPDVTEILIDDENVFQEVQHFVGIISPRHRSIVKLHTADKPIFAKHQLEEQIATIFENRYRSNRVVRSSSSKRKPWLPSMSIPAAVPRKRIWSKPHCTPIWKRPKRWPARYGSGIWAA
jgi:ribonuclease E